jgi:PmbA protein
MQAGATECLLQRIDAENTQLKFSHSEILTYTTSFHSSVELFLNYDNRLLFTTIHSLEKDDIDTVIPKIIAIAKKNSQKRDYYGLAKGPFTYPSLQKTYDTKVKTVDLKKYLAHALSFAKQHNIARADGTLEKEFITEEIVTSTGVHTTDRGTFLYGSFRAFADTSGTASGHAVCSSRTTDGFSFTSCAKKAISIAKKALQTPRTIPAGTYDVYLEPLPAANIIQHIGDAASIYSVEAGFSCFSDKKGASVANTKVSLYDDPHKREGFGTSKNDEEGVPTQKTPLIEKGRFKQFLFNTSFAQKYNQKTTGNAGILSPEPHQLVVSKGTETKQAMLGSIKKGIYVTNVWYTRFQNYLTGEFSTIPRDGVFYIEDGKVKHPVKNIRINTSLLAFLKNVKSIGKDQTHIVGWEVDTPVFTPSLCVRNVQISHTTDE